MKNRTSVHCVVNASVNPAVYIPTLIMYTATERRVLKRFCTAADLKSHQLMHSDVCSCYGYVVNISDVILSRYADVLIIYDAVSF